MRFTRVATIVVVVATTSNVRAEPASYVETAALVGNASPVEGLHVMFSASGSHRIGESPIWLHALVATGPASDYDKAGQGSATQTRAGAAIRHCASWLCGSFGVDAGWQHGVWRSAYNTMTVPDYTSNAFVVVPRITVDAGGTNFRGELGFEADEALVEHETSVYPPVTPSCPPSTTRGWIGGDLVLGVAYRW
jgi:hypothetical protein